MMIAFAQGQPSNGTPSLRIHTELVDFPKNGTFQAQLNNGNGDDPANVPTGAEGSVIIPEIDTKSASTQPDLTYNLIYTMPICQNLRDLVLNHHGVLQENWAYLHSNLVNHVDSFGVELNKSIRAALNFKNGDRGASSLLNELGRARETFAKQKELRTEWNTQALEEWEHLRRRWKQRDTDFDPERYLDVRIPANDTAIALSTFSGYVAPQNNRVRDLLDNIVCSGYDGDSRWPGMRVHYSGAKAKVDSIYKIILILEKMLKVEKESPRQTERMKRHIGTVLDATRKAREAASLGMNAAQAITDGLQTLYERTEQSAQHNWRITQDSEALLRQYLKEEESQEGSWRLLQLNDASESRHVNLVTKDGIEVSELWLATETDTQSRENILEIASIIKYGTG
ncbi:hypothetical protein F4806DRAFT_501692 [Annulohypoxylon nitens]|nr:hypothetical protein F4806DRAFT_501692 [Annulohypoxylon nitens]